MYDIPFERIEAIEHQKGAEGLRLTMVMIFQRAVKNNYQNILIFEDDLDIIEPSINEVMSEVVKDIPPKFDIIYMGCQLCNVPSGFYNKHLMKVKNAYATHAAIYSLKAINKLLNQNFYAPIDNCFCATIQNENNTYATYPILVSQIVSKSDIYNDIPVMDWRQYIQGRYWKQITAMKQNGTFNR